LAAASLLKFVKISMPHRCPKCGIERAWGDGRGDNSDLGKCVSNKWLIECFVRNANF
jgi:hypothetical protein